MTTETKPQSAERGAEIQPVGRSMIGYLLELDGYQFAGVDDLVKRDAMQRAKTVIEAQATELADARQDLGNLLARLHGDGGQHIHNVGWKQAVEEADKIICDMRAANEREVEP